jgi:two-component system sensor histidine kinase UhpB
MKKPIQVYAEVEDKLRDAEALVHALRTRQVDAIVGERHHIMVVRLRQTEENLKASRDQLRVLAASLLSARDDERALIARELHDEFGQALTSLQLGLAWIARKVTPVQPPVQQRIRSMSATTTSMIRSVKNIAGDLRPGVVDELGLVKSLKSQAREFKARTGMPCGFKTNTLAVAFDRSAAVAVFRIVQAGLTNAARHAHASRAFVALMKGNGDLIVTVKDNGKGITRNKVDSESSIGIAGMRERALALGGTFALEGSASRGTVLTVTIPWSRAIVRTGSSPAHSSR